MQLAGPRSVPKGRLKVRLVQISFFSTLSIHSTNARLGRRPQLCHPERSRGTCCAPFPLTTPYNSVHPSPSMPGWRWMGGSTATVPTRFRLSTFSSTHSASCAVQKTIVPLIWTALAESSPGLTSWDILSNSQPSLTGLVLASYRLRTDVLGYFQPSLLDWVWWSSHANSKARHALMGTKHQGVRAGYLDKRDTFNRP